MLVPLVDGWPNPPRPSEARRRLTGWTYAVGIAIQDSSRQGILVDAMQEAWPMTIMEVNVWLDGRWSTRSSLNEWLWRLEISPHAISAADWLWTVGERWTGGNVQ